MSFKSFDQHLKESLKDKYEVLNLIGKGGMAYVYRAIQKGLDREVAIKVIHPSLVHDDETIQRFKLEAKSAAKLSHANIITVFEVGEKDNVVYICLEFLDGSDLSDLVKSQGRLRVDQLLSFMIPISSALAEIHDHSLIHRDIKSSNIFVTKKGRAVLLDFGIATFKENSNGTTLPGTVIGTPEYMSPEQANGRKVGAESDIYSMGIVMFQCLSGSVPFSGDSPISTLVKISQGFIPELDQDKLEIPQWLYDIVMKCLSTNPEDRFRSAQDLLKSLKAKKIVESKVSPKMKTANYDQEITLLNRKLNNSDNIEDKILALEESPQTIKEIYNINDEMLFFKSIKLFQKTLRDKNHAVKSAVAKCIKLLLSGEFEELLLQSENLEDRYSETLYGFQLDLIQNLATSFQEAKDLLVNIRTDDSSDTEKSDEGFVRLAFLLANAFKQITLLNFLDKPEEQQLLKLLLQINDQFHERVIYKIKDDKLEVLRKKNLVYKLLEIVKIQGEDLGRNREFSSLLIDLHNKYVYKNNKVFRLNTEDKGQTPSESEGKDPLGKDMKILSFDDEFNDLLNNTLLGLSKVKGLLSLSNDDIEIKTINRLVYMFFSPKVKDNGFYLTLLEVEKMIKANKKRYAYFNQYRVGEDLLDLSSVNKDYDLYESLGKRQWDENLKSYLTRLNKNEQYLEKDQLNAVLNQTAIKLIAQFKPYLAKTVMPLVQS